MSDSLNQVCINFQQKVINIVFGEQSDFDLSLVVQELFNMVKEFVLALVAIKLEAIDDAFLESKEVHVKYKVEHKKRERTIHSQLGDIVYKRTYFKNRKTSQCSYLVDIYAHISKHQRLTNDLTIALAKAALSMPYRKATEMVTGNTISHQTVTNAIRRTEPVSVIIDKKKKVDCLHIDVDEDHISLVDNKMYKGDIVRLAVCYEGVEKGSCINPIAIGRYEKNADEFWETVVDEIYEQYDLTDTDIYIHADGASWIAKANDYFINTKFVLDQFHKNKYLKKIFSCVKNEEDKKLESYFRTALLTRNIDVLKGFLNYIKNKYSETISKDADKAFNYLLNNIEGIAIRKIDEEAKIGGFSEQHVSNYLSNRLSSRPRVWSPKTLDSFVPMLTARRDIKIKENIVNVPKLINKVAKVKNQKMLFSYNPNSIGNIPSLAFGKVTPLYNSLCWVNY